VCVCVGMGVSDTSNITADLPEGVYVYVCVCVCVCMRACVRVCACGYGCQ